MNGIHDGTDTDEDTSLTLDKNTEHHNRPSPNPRSKRNDLRHNPEPKCNENYRYCASQNSTIFSFYTLKCSTENKSADLYETPILLNRSTY